MAKSLEMLQNYLIIDLFETQEFSKKSHARRE